MSGKHQFGTLISSYKNFWSGPVLDDLGMPGEIEQPSGFSYFRSRMIEVCGLHFPEDYRVVFPPRLLPSGALEHPLTRWVELTPEGEKKVGRAGKIRS